MSSQHSAPPNTIAQIIDGESSHYIYQDGDELKETSYDGEFSPPVLVGSAKTNTPGTYLILGEGKRLFYCLDEDSALQNFQFNEEEDEWDQGTLVKVGIKPNAHAGIAAVRTSDGKIRVFFQRTSDGTIQSISCMKVEEEGEEEEWSLDEDLPFTQPSEHVSTFATSLDEIIYVFYTNADGFIHELVFNKEWTDRKVDLTGPYSGKHDIIATPLKDPEGYGLQFTDAEQKVYLIYGGELTLMGQYVDGVFKKDKGAEGWNGNGVRVVKRN